VDSGFFTRNQLSPSGSGHVLFPCDLFTAANVDLDIIHKNLEGGKGDHE
jgi:hypothetical protein